jgi:hypothetical protein
MVKMNKTHLSANFILAAILVLGIGFSSTIVAHTGATGVVKDRMKMMDDVGKDMKKSDNSGGRDDS